MTPTTKCCSAALVLLLFACTEDAPQHDDGGGARDASGAAGNPVGGEGGAGAGGAGGVAQGPGATAGPGGGINVPATCGAGFTCVPTSSWAKFYFSHNAATCPFPSEIDSESACDKSACDCADSDGTCDIDVHLASDTQCTDYVTSVTDGCVDTPDGSYSILSTVSDTCAIHDMPPTIYDGCAIWESDAQPCQGGLCVPEAPQQCIVTLAQCPSSVYTEEINVYSGPADCTCWCGGDGTCVDATILVSYDEDTCGGNTATLPVQDWECQQLDNVRSIEVGSVPSSSTSCSASSATISGSLGSTLCCMPES